VFILAAALMACQPQTREPEPVEPAATDTVADDWNSQSTEFVDGTSNEEWQNTLFDLEAVHVLNLTIQQGNYDALRLEPEEWVPADLEWQGMVFKQVGVRLKGNGSFQPIDLKPSLKIEFDTFGGADAFGLDKIVLNNMTSDPAGVREVTAYHLYRSMGVPAVRATHAELHINGLYRGVYTLMEDVQLRTFEPWGLREDGWLAEMFDAEFQVGSLSGFQHEDGNLLSSGVFATTDALELEDDGEAFAALESTVDMEAFLAFYAVSALVGQFDAYPYRSPGDDVHVYTDPVTEKLSFIPHGLDETFNDPARHMAMGPGLLASRCYFNPDCQARLNQQMWATMDTFEAIGVSDFMQHQFEKIQPARAQEPLFNPTEAAGHLVLIKAFADGRSDDLLDDMGPRIP